MIGLVDEAMREGEDGLYLVTVVVVETATAAHELATSLLLPRQARVHWHAEGDERRRQLVERLAAAALNCTAYVSRPVSSRRHERARALCMGRLLWDLRDSAVDELVIESRQERNDRRDRRTIIAAQKAHRARPDLSYRHERPATVPMLWLPDIVAGAVAAHLTTSGEDPLGRLSVSVVGVDL